jgi:nitroreductase
MIKELVYKNRNYRKFDQEHEISHEILLHLVDLARCSPSWSNQQVLRYKIVNNPKRNAKVFACTEWANFLPKWDGPAEGERPTAYIVQCSRVSNVKTSFDAGIACQSILLGATELGLGGCIIGSIDRERLGEVLDIPQNLDIVLIIALGKPIEKVVIEELEHGNIKYWRDENNVHHVPKRSIDEIVF